MKLKGQFRIGMMRKTGMIMKKGLTGANLNYSAGPKRTKEDEMVFVKLVISLKQEKYRNQGRIDQLFKLDWNLQIVWKATKKLGIGYARSPGDCQEDCKLVIVANYEPPQGMGLDVKTNVVPPTAKTLSGYRSQNPNHTTPRSKSEH